MSDVPLPPLIRDYPPLMLFEKKEMQVGDLHFSSIFFLLLCKGNQWRNWRKSSAKRKKEEEGE